ncbi:MAG: hypothetical protein H7831_12430 [Magnetococcus sp. WYHC-3]
MANSQKGAKSVENLVKTGQVEPGDPGTNQKTSQQQQAASKTAGPYKTDLPLKQGDQPIVANDTGPAVEKIQTFLQTLPEVQELEKYLTGFGQGYSLTDGNNFGNFNTKTGSALKDYQLKNKKRIIEFANLTEQQFSAEVNQVGYATWGIMLQDMGQQTTAEPTEQDVKEEKSTAEPLADPAKPAESKATHYVKTVNPKHRLALRKAPAWVPVSKEASEDNDVKGELVTMMENGTLLTLIEPYVGYNCEWHQVYVENQHPDIDLNYADIKAVQDFQPLFAFAEFIQPLQRAKPLLPVSCMTCNKPKPLTRKVFPGWIDLTLCDPWFDEETCAYYIAVKTGYESSNDSQIAEQEKEAMITGINVLLDFYTKQRTPNDVIDKYMAAYAFAEIYEWYLDPRPGSTMKFLVRIPAKYFDAIPEIADDLAGVPNSETGKLPEGFRTTHFLASKIEDELEEVATYFDDYANDVQDWGKVLPDFDFVEEAERIRSFIPVFQKFLEWNGSSLNTEEEVSYELGFEGKPCFNILYVLESQQGSSLSLRIGFDCFKMSEPIKYGRTMGYVFYASEIIRDRKQGKLVWSEFINAYTCDPPIIRPSNPVPPRIQEKKPIKFDGPVKTEKQKREEDKIVSNIPLKSKLAVLRSKVKHYIGDSMLACDKVDGLLMQIHSVDDLYTKILNKIQISDLTGFAASCLAMKFNVPNLRMMVCKMILKQLRYEELEKVLTFIDNTALQKVQEKLRFFQASATGKAAFNDAGRLRQVMIESMTEEDICRAITSFDPGLVEKKIKLLSSLELPELFIKRLQIPTIDMPDNLEIDDIMGAIADAIFEAVRQILASTLIELIKSLFRSLCEACKPNSPQSYGKRNLNDLPHKSGEDLSNLFGDFGLDDDPEATNEEMKGFFDDLSAILTPSELCQLLNGTASNEVLRMAVEIIIKKYPVLFKFFKTTSSIKNLFVHFGQFFDQDVCDAFLAVDEEPFGCNEYKDEDFRRELLSKKLSNDQVEEQLEKVKERNAKKLEQIMGLLDGGLLDDVLPDVSPNPCSGKKSILPVDPPSLSYLNNKLVDQLFSSVLQAFNSDLTSFLSLLTQGQSSNNIDIADLSLLTKAAASVANSGDDDHDKSLLMTKTDMEKQENKSKVAEGLLASLFKKSTVQKEGDITTSRASYVMKSFQRDLAGELEERKILKGNAPTKKAKQQTEGFLYDPPVMVQGVASECSDNAFGVEAKIVPSMIEDDTISADTLIRYRIEPTEVTKPIDAYNLAVNESQLQDPLFIEDINPVKDDLASIVIAKSFVPEKGRTLPQEYFAEHMISIIKKVVNEPSRKKLEGKNQLYTYFRDEAYHRLFLQILRFVMTTVADSKLFLLKEFQKIDFIGKTADANKPCPPSSQTETGLLTVGDLKQLVTKRYEKIANECSSKPQSMSPIEKSNLEGVVASLIRVYTIEYLLRAMFVFSKFHAPDIANDPIIVKYIVWKIEEDIRKNGGEFYDVLLTVSKRIVQERGDNLQEQKTPGNIGKKDERLNNELLSDNRTGLVFLEYLVKEQIEQIAVRFDNLLGSTNENIVRFIPASKMAPFGQVLNSLEDENFWYLKEYNFYIDPDDPHMKEKLLDIRNLVNRPTPKLIEYSGEGGFKLEQYIRVFSDNGKTVDKVVPADKFFVNNSEFTDELCGVYGMRLVYYSPLKDNRFNSIWDSLKLDFQGEGKSSPEEFFNNTKAYNTDKGNSHPIPVAAIEDDIVYKNTALVTERPEGAAMFNKLLEKLIVSNDYRFLFEFVFDMRRMLTLTTLYNISSIASDIPNIDNSFDNTKNFLRTMFRTLTDSEDWWRKENDKDKMGGNQGIYQTRMDNVKATGPAPFLAGIAAQTIPIVVKGLAERFDSAYKILKALHNSGNTVAGLSWTSLLSQVGPVNIFGPFGWGPPIGPYGILALSLGLLSGEQNIDRAKEDLNKEKCDEEETK